MGWGYHIQHHYFILLPRLFFMVTQWENREIHLQAYIHNITMWTLRKMKQGGGLLPVYFPRAILRNMWPWSFVWYDVGVVPSGDNCRPGIFETVVRQLCGAGERPSQDCHSHQSPLSHKVEEEDNEGTQLWLSSNDTEISQKNINQTSADAMSTCDF